MISKNLISNRYADNGISHLDLTDEQLEKWGQFRRMLSSGELNEERVESCFFCNSTAGYLVAEKDRYGNKLDTIVCSDCGIVRSLNVLDAKSLGTFYKDFYRVCYGDTPTPDVLKEQYEASAIHVPAWATLLKKLNVSGKNLSVFEIGAGGGWNLIPLQSLGAKVSGCDYGTDYVRLAQNHGINLFDGGAEDYVRKNPAARYDLVLIIQVLEHAKNPLELLSLARGLLKEGGHLVVSVPSLSAGGIVWRGDFLLTLQNAHNFLFDLESLKFVVESAGFEYIWGNRMLESVSFRKLSAAKQKAKIKNRGAKVVSQIRRMEYLWRPYWAFIQKIRNMTGRKGIPWGLIHYHSLLLYPEMLKFHWQQECWKRKPKDPASLS